MYTVKRKGKQYAVVDNNGNFTDDNHYTKAEAEKLANELNSQSGQQVVNEIVTEETHVDDVVTAEQVLSGENGTDDSRVRAHFIDFGGRPSILTPDGWLVDDRRNR